jgi:hypothetical protein
MEALSDAGTGDRKFPTSSLPQVAKMMAELETLEQQGKAFFDGLRVILS